MLIGFYEGDSTNGNKKSPLYKKREPNSIKFRYAKKINYPHNKGSKDPTSTAKQVF